LERRGRGLGGNWFGNYLQRDSLCTEGVWKEKGESDMDNARGTSLKGHHWGVFVKRKGGRKEG